MGVGCDMTELNVQTITKNLFVEHRGLIQTDALLFRKRVVKALRAITGLDRTKAIREYEGILQFYSSTEPTFVEPILRSIAEDKVRKKNRVILQADEDCYSVIEVLDDNTVGRCQSFLTRSEAESKYTTRCQVYPNANWVLIRGLGPISDDDYRLGEGEVELSKYSAHSA